jgi:hypothetical protein
VGHEYSRGLTPMSWAVLILKSRVYSEPNTSKMATYERLIESFFVHFLGLDTKRNSSLVYVGPSPANVKPTGTFNSKTSSLRAQTSVK